MSEKFITAGVTILIAIVGVAVVAVLVSKSSQTAGVLSASSGGFADALCVALSPLGIKCGSGTPYVTSGVTFGPEVPSTNCPPGQSFFRNTGCR